jgi:TIGR00159 family protein
MELIFLWEIKDVLVNMQLKDVIDILIVSYIFYNLYLLIKETRAEQLMKGILVLLAITRIAEILELQLLSWLLTHTIQAGMFALLIVFQPELRRILEYLGQTKFLSTNITNSNTNNDNFILELAEGMMSLSRQKIGALVILERKTGINEIIQTGTKIDGEVTRQLLINIFIPNTPLHDGAVVVRKNRIVAAGCFLPLTENKFLNQELGTRHRAALGISERSDCISLVVSEETGHISIAQNGKLYKDLKEDTLKSLLKKSLEKDQSKYSFFKKRGERK